MTYLIARIRIQPGEEAAVIAFVDGLVDASRAEAGCVRYESYREQADPSCLVIIEQWRDQAALEEHFLTPHFQAFGAKCGPKFAGEPELIKLDPLKA